MKQIIILLLAILVPSCSNHFIENGKYTNSRNKEEMTTIALLNKIDTTQTYYTVFKGGFIYCINTKSRLVEYRIADYSGIVLLLLGITIVLLGIITILKLLIDS